MSSLSLITSFNISGAFWLFTADSAKACRTSSNRWKYSMNTFKRHNRTGKIWNLWIVTAKNNPLWFSKKPGPRNVQKCSFVMYPFILTCAYFTFARIIRIISITFLFQYVSVYIHVHRNGNTLPRSSNVYIRVIP